jgi:tetratricopeptide (TPR) repeat protein
MLEGLDVLEEIPTGVGVILWEALRDVTLWAECDAADRARLFAPEAATHRGRAIAAAGMPADLAMVLQPLTALLDDPAQAPQEVVASACAAVSAWATAQSARRTSLAFAQASARARPTDAPAAVHVGDLARELGRYQRAASWYRRAVGLARRATAWDVYTDALLKLGDIALAQGNHGPAKLHAVKALRSARRHGVHGFTGDALRVLYHLAARSGDERAMETLARRAVRAYGRGHARLIPFLLELARAWLDRGIAKRAETILAALSERLADPSDIAAADALMARAAADLQKRALFEKSWTRAWGFLRARGDDPLTITILGDLSAAAARIGDWERIGEALERAGSRPTRRLDDKP